MKHNPFKEKTEMNKRNIMTDKKTKCDVCGKLFRDAHGASGICPKCQEEFEPDEMEFVDMDGTIHQRRCPRL